VRVHWMCREAQTEFCCRVAETNFVSAVRGEQAAAGIPAFFIW